MLRKEAPFTQGKWEPKLGALKGEVRIASNFRYEICSFDDYIWQQNPGTITAQMAQDVFKEQQTNIRLVCSAPELYRAVRQILVVLRNQSRREKVIELVTQIVQPLLNYIEENKEVSDTNGC